MKRILILLTVLFLGCNKRWDGWVCVIYADPDIVPYKVGNWANKIPIIDHNNPQGEYPKDYIPMPSK